jgi:hypothetical protein
MNFLALLLDQWRLSLGAFVLLSSLVALVAGKRQREAVLERLQFQRRRASGASTPPRSFSPDKKTTDNKASLSCTTPDYINTFPPSRRCVLPELAQTCSPVNAKALLATKPDYDICAKDMLPITRAYDLENGSPRYTPTGFSTAEIKAMGDFPAYDVLSGVPLPEPYENFDPAKALSRPYRPFRWAYHQTMCKYI